nr:DUF1799 domain-containing protein [Azospirillum oleiclasticum]
MAGGGEPEDAPPPDDPDEPRPFPVTLWRPAWPLFELFVAADRVWRYPAMGGPPIGLDLVQLRQLADAFGIAWDRETLVLVQAMEMAACAIHEADWRRRHPPKGPDAPRSKGRRNKGGS